jgi:hypothetical protein
MTLVEQLREKQFEINRINEALVVERKLEMRKYAEGFMNSMKQDIGKVMARMGGNPGLIRVEGLRYEDGRVWIDVTSLTAKPESLALAKHAICVDIYQSDDSGSYKHSHDPLLLYTEVDPNMAGFFDEARCLAGSVMVALNEALK